MTVISGRASERANRLMLHLISGCLPVISPDRQKGGKERFLSFLPEIKASPVTAVTLSANAA